MKKIFILFVFCLMSSFSSLHSSFAQLSQVTDIEKNMFKSVAHVAQNNFSVPTLIDVPLTFDREAVLQSLVVDSSNVYVPSTIVTVTQEEQLQLRATDSFGQDTSQYMVDGKSDTFTEFPFIESSGSYDVIDTNVVSRNSEHSEQETLYMEQKYTDSEDNDVSYDTEQNSVDIDVMADRSFDANTFTLTFDEFAARPIRVRVATVDSDNNEKIIVPEQFFGRDTIVFPQTHSDHYRITLRYVKPLRINEITFYEKNAPQMIERFVRFIAQSATSYDIYYNAQEYVRASVGESPNFSTTQKVMVIEPGVVAQNPLYKKIDTDGDDVLDNIDNCINVENSDQIDRDGNGIGDACEDFDRDGVINAQDNCLNVANRTQADVDIDGIGDACDGQESRFMERYPWIPYMALVVVFGIVVILIIRTLKHDQ